MTPEGLRHSQGHRCAVLQAGALDVLRRLDMLLRMKF